MENSEQACKPYLERWIDCKSLGSQFHSYYVYGERRDCTQLKENYDLCVKSETCPEAKKSLEQREAQQLAKGSSCLWELRTQPPADWPKPGSHIDMKQSVAEQMRIISAI